ncbi:MAG: hypothetical protein NT079_02075 [Candidatus Omnitrophica bacterium]|nr:hypothetical protein [Candidatus Omnitrophota bacterium]
MKEKISSFSLPQLFKYVIVFLLLALVIWAIIDRVTNAYLEDDVLWFAPLISQVIAKYAPWNVLGVFHSGELSLTDGFYFTFLISVFHDHLKYYNVLSIIFHIINTSLLFLLLKNRLKVLPQVSFIAALMYLTLYAHFHSYVWSLATHHLFVIFFLLIILYFYFEVNRRIEEEIPCARYYWMAIMISIVASFFRLSILIIPLIIFVHILFTTKDNRLLLKKYDIWFPLFVIFPIYQLVSLAYGGYGNILNGFLKPLQGLILNSQSIIVVLLAVLFSAAVVFVVRAFLRLFLKNKPADILYVMIGGLSFVVLLTTKTFALCLYTFLWPIQSAAFDHASLRFQSLFLPSSGTVLALLWAGTAVLMVFFLWYMLKKNRHLIIFIPWYLAVSLYMHEYADFTFSRYLVYVSPFFCFTLALFFTEILPSLFAKKWSKKYYAVFYVFLAALLMLNIFAIKIRSLRTMLVDNHWSYDYIKISHVINDDLVRRNVEFDSGNPSIYITGIKDIPYRKKWQFSFLKDFDFSKYDPFRKTLASVLNKPKAKVFINEPCPPTGFVYHVNNFTVTDKDGQSIEPFYQFFDDGLNALKKGETSRAVVLFEKAVSQKPFLINFAMGPAVSRSMLQGLLVPRIADTMYDLCTYSYEDDEKINYIDSMIQREAKDYGAALGLLSYLKNLEGRKEESQILMKRCVLFIDKRSVDDYLLNNYLLSGDAGRFRVFLDENQKVFDSIYRPHPEILVGSYKGFNFHWQSGYYFGLKKEEEPFFLDKFKGGRYKKCFAAKTERNIMKRIDAQ